MVEFALVLPLLMLLVVGLVDFGRALNYWIDATHLANIGARQAAVNHNPDGSGSLQNWIRGSADTSELRDGGTNSVPAAAQVCINFPDGSAQVGDPVEATVSVNYSWIPLLGEAIGVGDTTLTGSATMRLEQEPSEYAEGCS
jgi:Flp pilus assembly protein TadG